MALYNAVVPVVPSPAPMKKGVKMGSPKTLGSVSPPVFGLLEAAAIPVVFGPPSFFEFLGGSG